MVDGKRLDLKNASGIPMSPKGVSVPSNSRTGFALFFPPIERLDASIDLVFNSQFGVQNIKL